MNESGVTPTLAEIYGDVEYVLRDDGDGVFEVSYPRSRKTPRRVIGRIRDEQFFPANEWREPTGRGRGQAGRDDVDFLTGKRTAPDPPAASGFQRPWCAHSKFARGCPSCAVHWLKSRGVVSVQPFTGNVVGLACFRRLRGR